MRILRIILMILCAGLAQAATATGPRPFELGIVPYLPTTTLVTAYQPLRAHLEEKLQRPVVLTTAPDFITFLERCLRKEYDAIVLGPGLGRFLQTEAGYLPVVVTRRNIKALVIVERHAPYTGLKDLSGKRVALLDPMLALSQLGKEIFRLNGLQPERDLQFHVVKSPSNAVHAVLQGEVDAGVTTANLIPQLEDDLRLRLRILAESREIPGLMFMLLPGGSNRVRQVQDILLQFENSVAGQQFFEVLALEGLRVPGERELKAMDGFQSDIRKRLKP
jgi:phosphonate transport system substrate-binding protein